MVSILSVAPFVFRRISLVAPNIYVQ